VKDKKKKGARGRIRQMTEGTLSKEWKEGDHGSRKGHLLRNNGPTAAAEAKRILCSQDLPSDAVN
jgi:hypothetical protein